MTVDILGSPNTSKNMGKDTKCLIKLEIQIRQ